MNLKRWLEAFKIRSKTLLTLLYRGSFKKIPNYLLATFNMICQPKNASHYPLILVIDPANICNLSCALCITGQKKALRKPQLLTFSNFQKIIDNLGRWAIQLDLYNWGETLLNKDLVKMIAYAKKAGLRVETSSNLLLLTPSLAVKMVKSGLDSLIVSLHGASPKTTKIYMKGGNFNKALANLRLLVKTKKRLKSNTPFITWRYVISRYNEHEIEKANQTARSLKIDRFQPLPLKFIGYNPANFMMMLKNQKKWLPNNSKYCLYSWKGSKLIASPGTCFWPWEMIAIAPDGGIQPCCVFEDPKYDFGNIFTTPFWQIWNGKKYRLARKIIREKIKTNKNNLCGLCLGSDFIGK